MDPAQIVIKLATGVVGPLVKKLFVTEGPGAGLVDRPVRLSSYVSFRGEKRTLTDPDLRRLAAALVKEGLRAHERAVPRDEEQAVVDALASTLYALGELSLSDVEAVALGHEALARELRRAGGHPERHLSADATHFYDRLLTATCLHVLHFFTQRTTFVPATVVQQSRRQARLDAKVDELMARTPRPDGLDAAFERRYLGHVARKHAKLTIYGLDLTNSPGIWPLDAAYLSLEATAAGPRAGLADQLRTSATRYEQHPGLLAARIDRFPERAPEPPVPCLPIPADQALAGHERVLLRGEAGSGKTTLVQWLAVSAARRGTPETADGTQDAAGTDDRMTYLRDRIPFVLPLRTLTRHGERLPAPKDFLAAVGSPLAGEQPPGWESRVLTAGRGLLLVDGIDEIPDAERSRTRSWLGDLIGAFPGNRWLVTSRPSAVREDWLGDEDFAELTMSTMSPSGVAAFIRRWHTAAGAGTDDDGTLAAYEAQLLDSVRTKPDLGRLATNPLMCGLICALHRDRRGFLPYGRKDLYDAALTMLLTRRDRERSMAGLPELREEPQLQLLQRIAYWLIRNGRTEMDRSRAEQIIGELLPAVPEISRLGDAAAVYTHFLHRSGLLREPGTGTVEFVHRTFQDFLGARAAVEEGAWGELVRHAADDQWEDVVRMAVAHARPRERRELFGELLAFGDNHESSAVRMRVHMLAATCLEHAAELDPAVRAEVERHTTGLIPPVSPRAAQILAKAGPLILDLLPGPDGLAAETAECVVIAASHTGSDRAIPYMARFARRSDLNVRRQLAWSWGRFDTQQYADEVIAHLDPTDLYFCATTEEQLAALRALGPHARLEARGDLPPAALRQYLRGARPEGLRIRDNETLRDLSFLAGQDALADLTVAGCPKIADLSHLPDLPLRTLALVLSGRPALAPLGALDGLEELSLGGEAGAVSDLPAGAPLRHLTLSWTSRPDGGLRGIDRCQALERLVIGMDCGPQDQADWDALALLPRLRSLYVSGRLVAAAPPSARLASPSSITLPSGISQHTVDRLPHLFPAMRTLMVRSTLSDVDLSPLAAARHLRRIWLTHQGGALRGMEALGPGVAIDVAG
ncbi:NACHT domain-containing NTPase [Streptomyces sp. NBC_00083]|uniref:NACHT domain-containing protein n=1 Tax=Streptomyces sp. NBC_00083 TaxID=2975647 RepID=UPI00225251C1|nr:NACHT domain-containing protein [Streptomyces sp. NBC_00083]MCX5387988.1 NACHT domain-containing protein [Streptomyces sp. NBC_00083]